MITYSIIVKLHNWGGEKNPFGNDDNIFVSNFLRFLEKVGTGKSLISEEKTSTSFKIQGASMLLFNSEL